MIREIGLRDGYDDGTDMCMFVRSMRGGGRETEEGKHAVAVTAIVAADRGGDVTAF